VAFSFAELNLRDGHFRIDLSKILFFVFLVLLAWVPIPLGSNRPWAWTLLEVTTFALVGAWVSLWAFGAVHVPDVVKRARPALIVLVAWLVLQALHFVPLPPTWVAALSPESARMHSSVGEIGIPRDWMTLSIDPQASRVSFLKSVAYAGVFFLTLVLVSRRSRLFTLAGVLVYGAVLHAVYAVLMHLVDAREVHFGTWISHGASASGTYANRNHFAALLYMSLAVGIGLLIAGHADRNADSWKRFVRLTIEWILSPKMILRLSLCILVIALTTTHSRMGNSAFFSSLIIAGAIGIALSRYATRSTVILLASLVAIDLFIVGSWFGVDKLAQRLEQTTVEEVREREHPAAHTIPLIKDYAVFGSGPGTFYVAFPRYRPHTIVNFFNHTHNDYAQFASESGILGLTILGSFVALALGAALVAQWKRRDPLMRGMSFACVMGVTAILIHSWVDFNLQIPANAMLFMVLLALGWISLYHDRRTGSDVVGILTRLENGK
jgi:putative inorganic carbon (HCO3(-)) transporter